MRFGAWIDRSEFALGLAAGKAARELPDPYHVDGKAIFPPGHYREHGLRSAVCYLYRYDRAVLTRVLKNAPSNRRSPNSFTAVHSWLATTAGLAM